MLISMLEKMKECPHWKRTGALKMIHVPVDSSIQGLFAVIVFRGSISTIPIASMYGIYLPTFTMKVNQM